MKIILIISALFFTCSAKAQKVDSLFFNLYTDSLKKGVHNYINVDGKRSDGSYFPLMSDEVTFTSSLGKWEGNSLIIDRELIADSIKITAFLKAEPQVKKTIIVYLKKIIIEPPLKTEKEILEQYRRPARN